MMNDIIPPRRTGSLGEVFRISFPLIMSAGTFAFKLFTDRMMLAWYEDWSIAAALSAGMASFMFASFFMGIVNYANAFVAQYSGAERHDRTGLAVWQAIFFSLAAGVLMAAIGRLTAPLFHRLGHPPELAGQEETYYLILAYGAAFPLLMSSLMCFWTGRNRTWTVVLVGFSSIILNVVCNWALIFGAQGSDNMATAPWPLPAAGDSLNRLAAFLDAPRLGVAGAGLATIGTDAFGVAVFLILFLRRGNRREFGTWPARLVDTGLMWRMIRFGFGNGMQLSMDIGSFAVFNLLMGMYGVTAGGANVGAASGIAVSVNAAAFIPMLGIGAAASILVGQGIGARDTGFAVRSIRSARYLIVGYMLCMSVLFEIFPAFLVSIFAPGESMNPATRELAAHFLRFVGVFCLADSFFILYGNAVRGAGDTRFSMYAMMFTGWFLFAFPCILAYRLGASHFTLWCIIVVYAFISAAIFYWRYRQGKWKNMRVIEETQSRRLRAGGASVRLSSPVASEEAIVSVPATEIDGMERE